MLQHLKTSWRFIADVKFINYNLLIKTICEYLDRVGGRLDSVELKTVKGTDRWDVGGQWVCRWEQLEIISYIIEKMGSREIRSCSSYGGIGINPLHPNIRMHILHTVLYTFLEVLKRRICWTVRSSLVVDHFLDSHDLNVWFRVILWGEIRCQSLLGVKGLAKFKLARFYRTIFFVNEFSNNETIFLAYCSLSKLCEN